VTRAQDIRDKRSDAVQRLVDEAFDNPANRGPAAALLFGDQPVQGPPGSWPPPTIAGERRAHAQCRAAAEAAHNQLRAEGTEELATGLHEFPRAGIVWDPLRPGQRLPLLPLVRSLLDDETLRRTMKLASLVHTRHTAPLFHADIRKSQLLRLNSFARLEIELWRRAAIGGHAESPPYTVRFYLARWFWDPSISGTIFCLRCGDELHYTRRERTHTTSTATETHPTRTARCRTCSRGRENDWPPHAHEPFARGTWLLQCAAPNCTQLFIGPRQARYCESHRLRHLTPSKRVPSSKR
jgi:hypothetical protein